MCCKGVAFANENRWGRVTVRHLGDVHAPTIQGSNQHYQPFCDYYMRTNYTSNGHIYFKRTGLHAFSRRKLRLATTSLLLT